METRAVAGVEVVEEGGAVGVDGYENGDGDGDVGRDFGGEGRMNEVCCGEVGVEGSRCVGD